MAAAPFKPKNWKIGTVKIDGALHLAIAENAKLKKQNAVLEAKLKKLKSFVFVESDFEKTMFELPIVLCRKANTRLKHFIEDHVESITEKENSVLKRARGEK